MSSHRLPFALLLVSSLFALACLGGGGSVASAPAPPPPRPNFVVGDTNVTDACAGFFSSCSRADCTVVNAGDGAGTINVEMTVTSSGGKTLTHGETLSLAPGERKTIQYDFNGFSAATVHCGGKSP